MASEHEGTWTQANAFSGEQFAAMLRRTYEVPEPVEAKRLDAYRAVVRPDVGTDHPSAG